LFFTKEVSFKRSKDGDFKKLHDYKKTERYLNKLV